MRIIENPVEERKLVESIIKKYGYTPDHNFDWFLYCSDEGEPRVFMWDDDYAIFAYENIDNNSFILLSDPIAPEEQHEHVLKKAIDFIPPRYKKITIFDVRNHVHNLIKNLYPNNYKFYYDTVWPVVDMILFNPELPGGRLKSIRNALNKFRRENKIEVVPALSVAAKQLHEIVGQWLENRMKAGIEELYPKRYHNMIDGNFAGTKSARVMMVNGKPAGFNAGWETPNADKEWSAAIGLHDFSIKDLGIALLMEDLEWVKNAGYRTCDLEGSDPQALKFKTQFFSEYKTYKTHTLWLHRAQ